MTCICPPEHQVYSYDDSESPRGPAAKPNPNPSPPDAVTLLNESPRRPGQSSDTEQEEQDQLKLSRCLSDPGPKNNEGEDDSFPS